MTTDSVTVFISWSGELSRGVAHALRRWIPSLYDQVSPWMSDEDIASGARGLEEIHQVLAGAQFGIILVTAENQASPWLNYEAGAISRSLGSAARVVPLLIDLSRPAELRGPLAQYQARVLDRVGMEKLVATLSAVLRVDTSTALKRFEAFWPELEAEVRRARAAAPSGQIEPRTEWDMLSEILERVRRMGASPAAVPSSLIEEIEYMVEELERPPTALDFREPDYSERFISLAADLRQIAIALDPR